MFKTVLADVAVLDGVCGDEGAEPAGPQQPVDAADKVGNEVAESGGGVFPFDVFAEGMAIESAEVLSAFVGRVAEDEVETCCFVLGSWLRSPVWGSYLAETQMR